MINPTGALPSVASISLITETIPAKVGQAADVPVRGEPPPPNKKLVANADTSGIALPVFVKRESSGRLPIDPYSFKYAEAAASW